MIAPNKVRNSVVLLCQNAVQLSLSSFLGISLLPFQDILFGKKMGAWRLSLTSHYMLKMP